MQKHQNGISVELPMVWQGLWAAVLWGHGCAVCRARRRCTITAFLGTEPDLINSLNPSWLCTDPSWESLVSCFLYQKCLHTWCAERSKWLCKGSEGLLIWCEFHFVELWMGFAQSFRYLSPAYCQRRDRSLQGWCRVKTGLGLVWCWCQKPCRLCWGEERCVEPAWVQRSWDGEGSKPLSALTACAWSYLGSLECPMVFVVAVLPSLANEHLVTLNNGDVTVWIYAWNWYARCSGEGYILQSVLGIAQPSLSLLFLVLQKIAVQSLC